MSESSVTAGQQVKRLRKSRGMSMEELGLKINKSKSTVSKYESGEISMDLDTMMEIAKALSVHVFQIIETCCRQTELRAHPGDSFMAENMHIYYYDGRLGRVRHGIITALGGDEKSVKRVMLNMNVGESRTRTGVEYFSQGTVTTYDTFSCFRFEQVNGIGDAYLYAYKPFGVGADVTGMLTGIFKNPIAPGAVKVLLSANELEENSALKSRLVLTSAELTQMKKINMMIIGNQC